MQDEGRHRVAEQQVHHPVDDEERLLDEQHMGVPVQWAAAPSSHSSTDRCFSHSRWVALCSSAGDRIRSR
ncbi:hypothetical protein ACFSL4_02580, partial [Streptomyces caeni]